MDPPECSGHSHDHCDHGDDLGLSLRPQMDLDAVRCLNESRPNAGSSILKLHEDRLSSEPYLTSNEEDPELLLHIPFVEDVILKHLSIRSVGSPSEPCSPPKEVRLFVNRDDLDFDTARELEPAMKLELLPPHHFTEGTIDYPLRPAGRFQHISSLTIFVVNNYPGDGDDEEDEVSSFITYVGLKGQGTHARRGVVNAIYEAKPMPSDHKTPGMDNMAGQIL
eukprot:Nitzschia sp. Nitz4//scaffold261_size27179//7971//8636//NITZ4_008207-RA/size27179-processed-gene-0.1-mRNA-1//1//CDS//3329544711//2110//frame0